MNHHARDTPVNRLEDLLRRRGRRPLAPPRAGASDPLPLGAGAEYRYRLASHKLTLAFAGVTRRQSAAVRRGEAEFALAVSGPLLVLGYRFGTAIPWAWAAPYNWHFAPPAERVVPASIPLTPDTYARLWSTLWITLLDADDGRVCATRAVALPPEFTHALHRELRRQAMRPFRWAAVGRELDLLRTATDSLAAGVRATARCPGVWVPAGDRPA